MQCGFCTPGPGRGGARPAGPRRRRPTTPRSARRSPATCAAARATRRSSTRCGWPAGAGADDRSSSRAARSRRSTPRAPSTPTGTSSSTANRITAVGAGPAPARRRGADRVSTARGCLLTPGLVNTHHHLYQWATRGLAQRRDAVRVARPRCTRCGRGIDAEIVRAAARPGLAGSRAPAARRAPTTTTSSRAAAATCWRPRSRPRGEVGLRFHPTRGSMDLGASQGGLPPDSVVEDRDAVLAATEAAIDELPRPGARLDAADRASRRARRSRSPAS